MTDRNDLMDRVRAFQFMELPGQPRMMHMGTSYLVQDLVTALREADADGEAWRLRAELAEAQVTALKGIP